jgi:hypothetical protein
MSYWAVNGQSEELIIRSDFRETSCRENESNLRPYRNDDRILFYFTCIGCPGMAVQERPQYLSRVPAAGCLLIILGVAVLVGWLADIGFLTTVLPGRVSMKPNTAIGFLCAGLSIVLLTKRFPAPRSRWLSAAFAVIVINIGLLTLVEYGFHVPYRVVGCRAYSSPLRLSCP